MKNRLKEDLKLAMKARDQVRVDTIRSLISELTYEEIQKGTENLPQETILGVLKTALKKRKEEMEYAEKAARAELIEKLKTEMAVIEGFLPQQLGAEALEKLIVEMKSKNPALNMGEAMKLLKDGYAGQYDGKIASDIAKRVLA